jgi:hypothetical protein
MAEYAKDVLVTTEWLAEHLDDTSVVVAEVDENPDLYDDGASPARSYCTGATTCRTRWSATSSTRRPSSG